MVLDKAGEVVHRFGGLWHEGIFCDTLSTPKCLWKPSEYPLNGHGNAAEHAWPHFGLQPVNGDTLSSLRGFCSDVQPDDHFQFYGFSRYARELNELTPDLKDVLPPTDTRFRPDQRWRSQLTLYSESKCLRLLICARFWHWPGSWKRGKWRKLTKRRMRWRKSNEPGGRRWPRGGRSISRGSSSKNIEHVLRVNSSSCDRVSPTVCSWKCLHPRNT